jgi:hypothetical protein
MISEISRRSSLAGAVLASVPIVSVLAMVWLYTETRDLAQVTAFSKDIVWLVLPSLVLFLVLPVLIERGHSFFVSLALSTGATVVAYLGAIVAARVLGFRL